MTRTKQPSSLSYVIFACRSVNRLLCYIQINTRASPQWLTPGCSSLWGGGCSMFPGGAGSLPLGNLAAQMASTLLFSPRRRSPVSPASPGTPMYTGVAFACSYIAGWVQDFYTYLYFNLHSLHKRLTMNKFHLLCNFMPQLWPPHGNDFPCGISFFCHYFELFMNA